MADQNRLMELMPLQYLPGQPQSHDTIAAQRYQEIPAWLKYAVGIGTLGTMGAGYGAGIGAIAGGLGAGAPGAGLGAGIGGLTGLGFGSALGTKTIMDIEAQERMKANMPPIPQYGAQPPLADQMPPVPDYIQGMPALPRRGG
jgi:hypothetical protein